MNGGGYNDASTLILRDNAAYFTLIRELKWPPFANLELAIFFL